MREHAYQEATEQVIETIEPLLKEAQEVADTFEVQLKEKKNLIKELNESLEKRFISLNLLINRVDKRGTPSPQKQSNVYDQQEEILKLYKKGEDTEAIAKKLSMPKGEIELVIELKKKFLEMAKKINI
ncbi:MAG: hypothetical protein HQK79_04520 [Desulfobacterales bacterium]|nr:hypothetical protein [Desulfobacterales bacterium]MBF0396185.1 hypothetical protein [Desulfobacterales bacterium]